MGDLLSRLALFCARRALLVAALGLLLGLAAAGLSYLRLGVTTDTDKLFSASLPWKQQDAAMSAAFPQSGDLLVAVVNGQIPEEAEQTAAELAESLKRDTVHFTSVQRPDALPYLEQEGLLFLDKDKLQALLDQTIDAQPFLGQLAADPTLRGLVGALALIGQGVQAGQADLGPYLPALKGFHAALAAAAAGKPQPLSWETLLSGPLAEQAGKYRFVLARPKLDYGALEPGGAATQALRAAAAQLEFVKSGAAQVRVTGSVALDDEEFATVAEGAVSGLVASLVLVTVWLFLAVGSWRLIVPILATLVLGLVLTSGFAALAVGTLNLISIAFAILFVGIAVDFGIQFSVRFREMRLDHPELPAALAATARRAGVQVLVAACATAAGFLAFTPTAFAGVAQLGVIAGVGMLFAFACTLTFLPSCLALFRPHPEAAEIGFRWARPLDAAVVRARWPIVAVFAALGLLGAALLPRLTFDSDPLHTKNQTSESVRTLYDLISDPITNPYTIDILTPSADAAAALAQRLDKLPLVDEVRTLDSFVPKDQDQKLPLIQDAAGLLAPTLDAPPTDAPLTPAALRRAIGEGLGLIEPATQKLPPDHPLTAIAGDLRALEQVADDALMAANKALTRFLPMQLDRLRTALSAKPVTRADLPPEIARDWVTPDGRAKVEVMPKREAQDSAGLHRFVAEVSGVAPEATGSAVTIVRSADTIVAAFRFAAAGAVCAIAVILFAALRRLLDMAMVLGPLLLSALLTVVVAVLLPLPLNFANIIALPLLLGVGVSFNIYFVMNWRAGQTHPLGSATARAVMLSALTTATAFGSLALSGHPGTASMGDLLLLSLGCTLVATLVFVPALLAVVPRPRP